MFVSCQLMFAWSCFLVFSFCEHLSDLLNVVLLLQAFQIRFFLEFWQALWQDDFDPDTMTYEELVDLGETVGTQSKGLSPELISLLPTSKCKFGSFFSRKRSGERCVICQMKYKIGDKQIKLLCKHAYHSECITKWLGINKVCPVCNDEVFGEESRN
ncbi:e3 ubiquitin ligase big brother [Populus alba x Populus x berolinensis]|nr:e3 ubiquitin ligase big brother [Populus alba x Populus x berolinensis]